jgi:WD40 repeat protein
VHCPVVEMATRSKLSCLSWNKYSKNVIASSDYEGIVTVWDVQTRQVSSLCSRVCCHGCITRQLKAEQSVQCAMPECDGV